MDFRK